MKSIEMIELEIGDIFCYEMKLNGREAFEVTDKTDKNLFVKSRKSGELSKKTFSGNVVLLKKAEI